MRSSPDRERRCHTFFDRLALTGVFSFFLLRGRYDGGGEGGNVRGIFPEEEVGKPHVFGKTSKKGCRWE
jgi:hypothetical protein